MKKITGTMSASVPMEGNHRGSQRTARQPWQPGHVQIEMHVEAAAAADAFGCVPVRFFILSSLKKNPVLNRERVPYGKKMKSLLFIQTTRSPSPKVHHVAGFSQNLPEDTVFV